MDELKIESVLMTKIVSKVISVALKKKIGCDTNIQLNSINVTVSEGKTNVHLDANMSIEKEELLKLLKNLGY